MLNIRTYGNLSFGYGADKAVNASRERALSAVPVRSMKVQPQRRERENEADKNRVVLKEGVLRDKRLTHSRPVMLSHTSVNYADWLSQLETNEERNLAMKVLQNFVYIDLDNARKGFRKIHTELGEEIDLSKTKFATLGNSKSGSMMGYLYRQANKMRSKGPVEHQYTDHANKQKEEQFLNGTELQDKDFNARLIERGFENIVIVDDMIGDGDSLKEYFTPQLVNSLSQYKNIYYVTLIKDPDGEKKIHDEFPELNIQFRCAEEVHKYDSPENKTFSDKEKAQLDEMTLKYGNKIEPNLVDKYSRSKLFVAFDWNTPGNTPMMFNYSTKNWNALFERYNGLENNDVGTKFDFHC